MLKIMPIQLPAVLYINSKTPKLEDFGLELTATPAQFKHSVN